METVSPALAYELLALLLVIENGVWIVFSYPSFMISMPSLPREATSAYAASSVWIDSMHIIQCMGLARCVYSVPRHLYNRCRWLSDRYTILDNPEMPVQIHAIKDGIDYLALQALSLSK